MKLAHGLLLHKRTNAEIQIGNFTFKKYHFGPSKKCVFEENPPTNFFFMFRLWFSFKNNRTIIFFQICFFSFSLNNRPTNILLVGIFEIFDCQNSHFSSFWRLITFFCAFSKILIKITFVRLLFLKLKQKKNMKKYFFMVFISKLKNALFWGSTNFFQFFFFSFSF